MNKVLLVLFLTTFLVQAQDSTFNDEVLALNKKYDSLWDVSKPTIVFTGSSSIRLWKDLEERFPEHHILNTGFGGSEAHDLLVHLDDLVLKYNPKKVFIYEGDNDISNGKRPRPIIKTFEAIISRIEDANAATQLVIISPKPSIARWRLKGKYKRLNKKLKNLAEKYDQIVFVDVWHIMLHGKKLNEALFIKDGLHMNTSGYDLWYKQLKEHVN